MDIKLLKTEVTYFHPKYGDILYLGAQKALPPHEGEYSFIFRKVSGGDPIVLSGLETETSVFPEKPKDAVHGMKFDGTPEKLRWDLVPTEFSEVVKVLTLGAKKYCDNNWMHVDPAYARYYAAARRHMEDFRKAIQEGKPRLDKEMGTHLLANAICCLMFLMYMDMNDWPNQKEQPTDTPWNKEAIDE